MSWRRAAVAGTRVARGGHRSGGLASRFPCSTTGKQETTDCEHWGATMFPRGSLCLTLPPYHQRMGNSVSSSLGQPAAPPVNQIQETISDNCVVIFSKTSCSYCTMAKKLFHDINVNCKVVELDTLEYGSQFQDALYRMTGERTVPRIFVNGTFIGGATDTHRLHEEGKLLPLVRQCYLKKSNTNFSDSKMPVIQSDNA